MYVCQRVAELFLVYCLFFFCFTTVTDGVKVAEADKSALFLWGEKKNLPPSSFLILMFPAERRLESLLPSGWLGVAAEASFLPLSSASPNFMWVAERMCLRLFAPFMSEKLQRRPLSSSPIIDDRSGTSGERRNHHPFLIYLLSIWRWNTPHPQWKNKRGVEARLAGLQVRDAR